MKNKKMLLIFAVVISMLNCSNENISKNNNMKKQNTAENTKIIKNSKLKKEDLKSIDYSNMADKDVQKQIRESLENSKVNSSNIDLFFKSVNYYNETTENKGLIKKGFINSKNINPTYDEAAIQQIWDKKNKNFPGFNCRITAFTLMKDYIKMEKPAVNAGEMLFMDLESLKNTPFELFSQNEKEKFVNLFSEIPTKATKDVKVHVENVKYIWKKRGIKFDKNSKISMISVFFHFNDDPKENILFIGHVGILVPQKDGKLLFIEKLAFQQPYQVLKFNNRLELNDYLMNKYDTAWGQPVAKPFIMENDELLKEYRANPNNKN
ncbi:DUF4300 family protein [Leptotrichia sp. oral taxon 847]|uniref:DUF4300 family protein n=1 Tax=Leptotrichia sp. oral taxon 847 TaxID=1785996 RepID=UPI0007684CC5|nr:DUF4300 family protein [Leptotrichia sp. oral taxon 847]AMD94852.1 hypothetical protein AXF11_04085 [Leptotrichia sp. oral taxon 847]